LLVCLLACAGCSTVAAIGLYLVLSPTSVPWRRGAAAMSSRFCASASKSNDRRSG